MPQKKRDRAAEPTTVPQSSENKYHSNAVGDCQGPQAVGDVIKRVVLEQKCSKLLLGLRAQAPFEFVSLVTQSCSAFAPLMRMAAQAVVTSARALFLGQR